MADHPVDVLDDAVALDAASPGFAFILRAEAASYVQTIARRGAVAIAREQAQAGASCAPRLDLRLMLVDAAIAAGASAPGYMATLVAAARLGADAIALPGVLAHAAARGHDRAVPATDYLVQLADGAVVRDLGGFIDALLAHAQGAARAEAATRQGHVAGANDAAQVEDVAQTRLGVIVVARDDAALDASLALRMVFLAEAVDGARGAGVVFDPGATTSWVVNTRMGFVTEYRGRMFASFGMLGRRHVGMSRDGLWALEGDADDGEPIVSRLRGGVLAVNGSRYTGLRAAFLGLRTASETVEHFLKLISSEGRTFVYRVRPRDMATVRVDLGRGLRARYFQWELELAGADFALDEIEFVPMKSARRM